MMVNGPLEIYSIVIGAKQFDNMFNILVSFGIAFIPLLVIFIRNIDRMFETQFDHAADTSIRKVGIELFIYVFSIMLFVAPTHKLDVTGIKYQPTCSPTASTSSFGDTGTTYDNDEAFEHLQYEDIRIPYGLAFILTATSGITNAAISSLPCKTDVQAMQNVVDTTKLTPQLSQSVNRFENECFLEARSKFDHKTPDLSSYQSTMNNFGGQSDLGWMGSHVFQQLYYSNMYPQSPVAGFPYNEYPSQYDAHNKKAGVATPKWGFPSCSEWWSDPDHGIQSQLVKTADDHQSHNPHVGYIPLSTKIQSWLQSVKRFAHLGSQMTPEDVISYSLLYDKNAGGGFGRNYGGYMDNSSGSHSMGTGIGQPILATVGQGLDASLGSIKRQEVMQEIPILQAVLLAICLAMGPLILILGNYQIGVIFSYYFILSSILAITFIEKFIHYLELSLDASQSYGLHALQSTYVLYNVFTKLYFGAPLLFLMLMSICGVKAGGALSKGLGGSISGGGEGVAKKAGAAAIKFIK